LPAAHWRAFAASRQAVFNAQQTGPLQNLSHGVIGGYSVGAGTANCTNAIVNYFWTPVYGYELSAVAAWCAHVARGWTEFVIPSQRLLPAGVNRVGLRNRLTNAYCGYQAASSDAPRHGVCHYGNLQFTGRIWNSTNSLVV